MADWKNIHLAEQGAVIAALRARVEKLQELLSEVRNCGGFDACDRCIIKLDAALAECEEAIK